MANLQNGFLLIADISGYTDYLTSSELEHAEGILQTLMELLIDETKPPLRISGLEGDAVFSYAFTEHIAGQVLVEMIENTYVAFRRAIDLMVLNTTCDCNACANIAALDLKFFLHHGTYTTHHLHTGAEILGSDVILIHRIMKNDVVRRTGISAYALYTEAAMTALELPGFQETLVPHSETLDVGRVDAWVQDLHPVWDRRRHSVRTIIRPDDVLAQVERECAASPHTIWEIITDPDTRASFLQVERQHADRGAAGRMGEGSTYRCFHGKNRVTSQVVVDWIPFEQLTTEDETGVLGTTTLVQFRLEPTERTTRVTVTASKARGRPLARMICNLGGRRVLTKSFTTGLSKIADIAAQRGEGAGALPAADLDRDTVARSVAESLSRIAGPSPD